MFQTPCKGSGAWLKGLASATNYEVVRSVEHELRSFSRLKKFEQDSVLKHGEFHIHTCSDLDEK